MAKEEIILEVKVEQGGAIAELEKTKKSIIGLKEEQAELNKAYKQGNISIDEYAQESVRVEQILKKQTKTQSDLTHQVQGTKSMTDQLKGSLSTLAPGVNSSIEGFKGMASAAKAFILTPIGAVIAAVAAALGIVVAALKKSEPVLDFFENIITRITAGVDFLLTNLQNLGKLGLTGLIKGMTESANAAQLYLNVLRQVEDAQNLFTIQSAASEKQIKALVIASKNRSLSFDEQREKIEEALRLEKELTDQRVELARQTEVATIKQIALSEGVRQSSEETFDQFVQRLLKEEELTDEQKKQVAELSAARIQAETSSLDFREKAQNRLDEIDQKQIDSVTKLQEAKQKAFEEEIARDEALAEFLAERAEQKLELDEEEFQSNLEREVEQTEELSNLKLNIEQDEAEQVEQIDTSLTAMQKKSAIELYNLKLDLMKKGMSAQQAELTIHKMVESQKLEATASTLGNIGSLLKKNTVAYKVAGTAQTLINTYQSAVAAYKGMVDTLPGPFGIAAGVVAAGASIALGLKNVAEINGVALAGGGKFTTKGPTLLLVGDNPGGRERVEVTPLSGRGTTRTFGRGGLAMAGGGSIDGSILAAASTQNIDTQFALQDSQTNMPPVYVSWTEKTEFENKMAFKAQLTEK